MKDKKIYNLSTDGYGRIVQIINGVLYDGFGNPISNIGNIISQPVVGPTGPQGTQGIQGTSGPQGPQGLVGSQGYQGPAGPQGLTGTQGEQGPTGPQGLVGSQGYQGPTGTQGLTGTQGEQGPTGPQGLTGAQGEQGLQGPTGPQGVVGYQGPTGYQGDQGPTGPQGTVGTQGPQGPIGGLPVFATGSIPFSDGTTLISSADITFDVTNKTLKIGHNSKNGKIYMIGDGAPLTIDSIGGNNILRLYTGSTLVNRRVCIAFNNPNTEWAVGFNTSDGKFRIAQGGDLGGDGSVALAIDKITRNFGFRVLSPTAKIHIAAGTASVNTAPLKFTSGTNLTTPEAGAVEYNGSDLFFTPSSTRNILSQISGATSLTIGSVPFATTGGYLTQDNSNLFWDNTNKRLGIGTASPAYTIDTGTTARAKIGRMILGAWSADTNYAFFGSSGFDQTVVGNYGLIQGSDGTFINTPTGGNLGFRRNNGNLINLPSSGGIRMFQGVGITNNLSGIPVNTSRELSLTQANNNANMAFIRWDLTTFDTDVLGRIQFNSELSAGGSGTERSAAYIEAQAAGTFTSTNSPGRLVFYTTPASSTTPSARMNINSDGNVSIGTGNANPNASALLELSSTTGGFLPPRMTSTQASAIASPAEGLLLYVTDTNGTFTSKGWWGYNGSAWEKLNN